MPETRQPRIEHALDLLEQEATYVNEERDAFERFRSRVADIEPADPTLGGRAGCPTGETATLSTSAPDPGARAVRTAYRETVLSVPHYDDDYGEPLAVNLEAELGSAVAAQVVGSGRLTPPVHDALLRGAEQAIEDRTAFRSTLETERESLCTVRDGLDECEQRAAELAMAVDDAATGADREVIDEELAALEATCSDLAASRQELLHGRTTAKLVGVSGESLVRFLYAECDATCPALADIADCIETIRRQRERCLA